MTDEEYAQRAPEAARPKMLEAMAKYGDNRWWLSDDPRAIGYHQLFENIMLVAFSKFHEGVEKLLCRPVWTHEFGLNMGALRNEAANAWLGVQRTEQERQQAIREGVAALYDYAEATGKQVFEVDIRDREVPPDGR